MISLLLDARRYSIYDNRKQDLNIANMREVHGEFMAEWKETLVKTNPEPPTYLLYAVYKNTLRRVKIDED